ncbi:MAG: hypothetical protein JW829_01925 [Pirellulales bacterium]|nr:hypothetical protein [Pirellulales bacterium]
MHLMMRVAVSVTISMMALPAADAEEPSPEIPTALMDYVKMPDSTFAWEIRNTARQDGCLIADIDLTSQTWQKIPWKHVLQAFVPDEIRHESTVLLFITGGKNGGRPDQDDMAMGVQLAKAAAAPVAFLHQVPNQPLLGNRVEDDLISETFLRFLDTNDPTWPLLFPMVKSAVRAMDALEQLAIQEYGVKLERFVVTGASKRGWTTWLSAVVDDRVAGIAPIVIDTLNLPEQMKHQMATWGEYSEQIHDYTSKGLVGKMLDVPGVPLWRWVDPYTYRKQLTLPKLMINGTNDRYWVLDALNLYWDGLVGEKHVFYVPNAGHGLDGGRDNALMTLAVFTQHVATDKRLPELTWQHEENDRQLQLTVHSTPTPESVQLWIAHSETKDFRPAKWHATKMNTTPNGSYVGQVPKPASGHVALYAEATYTFGPLSYKLSTQIRRE